MRVPERVGFVGGDRMVELLVASTGASAPEAPYENGCEGEDDDVEHRRAVKRTQSRWLACGILVR